MKSRALVLFDIDGTLVRRAGPHHREALVEAVRAVTGLDTTTENIPVHGMLDPDILMRMMRRCGRIRRTDRAPSAGALCGARNPFTSAAVPTCKTKTCPGVRRLLYALKRRGIPIGLVTGNLTRIGWKKMERAGLRHYFHFGVFAEMAPDRTALARMAIEHARRRAWIQDGARVSLIGDAPSDIIAARENGVRSIAVHTGISTREELAALSPDLLLEDLRALKIGMLV